MLAYIYIEIDNIYVYLFIYGMRYVETIPVIIYLPHNIRLIFLKRVFILFLTDCPVVTLSLKKTVSLSSNQLIYICVSCTRLWRIQRIVHVVLTLFDGGFSIYSRQIVSNLKKIDYFFNSHEYLNEKIIFLLIIQHVLYMCVCCYLLVL